MSRYGSVTIAGPASLLTRIVESAEPGDLATRVNAAIAALPVGYVVVGLTLAGAGDGHTFTVDIEAGAAADVIGGFSSAPTVVCFLASEAEALLLARLAAGPQSGVFADTQVAGASKGTRFMGMVVRGALVSSGFGILAMGQDALTESATLPNAGPNPTFVPRDAALNPMQVTFPTWNTGDVLRVSWLVGFVSPLGAGLEIMYGIPVVSLDGGGTWLELGSGQSVMSTATGASDVGLPLLQTYIHSDVGVAAVAHNGPLIVRIRIFWSAIVGLFDLTLLSIVPDVLAAGTGMVCERLPASAFVQPITGGLTP